MDHFQHAWERTAAVERGYVNNPNDPGGATNHGITEAVARRWGYTGMMRDLPKETAALMAWNFYWSALRLDNIAEISPEIAYEIFDTNFNLWSPAAGLFLQRALNALNRGGTDFPDLRVDGNIGPATLHALRTVIMKRGPEGERVLLRCLNAQQCVDYMRQCSENPKKETFFFGWVSQRVAM